MSAQDHEANLARIRENQRRSRARKREYLEELQQRLRDYERQGIEASAEVQMIARRVAEENRKLRELLKEHGYGDEYIEQYIKSATAHDGTRNMSPQNATTATHTLEQSLNPRPLTVTEPGSSFTLPSQATTITPSPPALHSSPSWDTISAATTPHFTTTGTDVSGLGPSSAQVYTGMLMSNAINSHGIQPQTQMASSFDVNASHTVPSSQPSSTYYMGPYSQQGNEYSGPGRGY